MILNSKRSVILADLFYPHSDDFTGGSAKIWIWVLVGGIVLIALGVFLVMRSKSASNDVEGDDDYKPLSKYSSSNKQSDEEARTQGASQKDAFNSDQVESDEEKDNS